MLAKTNTEPIWPSCDWSLALRWRPSIQRAAPRLAGAATAVSGVPDEHAAAALGAGDGGGGGDRDGCGEAGVFPDAVAGLAALRRFGGGGGCGES